RATARALSPRAVILPTGDSALQFLSACRDGFADLVDHDLPPAEVVDRCIRKDRFAYWAAHAGVPVPPTFVPRDAADVRAASGRPSGGGACWCGATACPPPWRSRCARCNASGSREWPT